MNDAAYRIFDYLPIRSGLIEGEYINHLWQSFSVLEDSDAASRPFGIMPFHLLFMISVQYKVMRLSKIHSTPCELFFCGVAGRDKEKLLSATKSVFDIGSIKERTMMELFRLIDLSEDSMKEVKALIDERNDTLAHAKGGIETKFDEKIERYLKILEIIQGKWSRYNAEVARCWIDEINSEMDMDQFIETRLQDSYLTSEDFGVVVSLLAQDEKLTFEQACIVLAKGLRLSRGRTLQLFRQDLLTVN